MPTTPATCPSERLTASSPVARSRCARERCGGCCTRPPRAPRRSSRSTSSSSISQTVEHPSALKAARLNGCTGAPARPTCSHDCCGSPTEPAAPVDRCSSPPAKPTPARQPPARDICPHTGRPRLGYDRARVLLHRYTGWRPHQLRHSAATHLGEKKVPLQLIMAKTRPRSPRTAMRYVHPGAAAVAEVTELARSPQANGHEDARYAGVTPGARRPRRSGQPAARGRSSAYTFGDTDAAEQRLACYVLPAVAALPRVGCRVTA